MSQFNYIDLAKRAREAARAAIKAARAGNRQHHFTHRGVEVIALDSNAERIGDPLDYLNANSVSGAQIRYAVERYAPAQYSHIAVQGGVDCFESFQAFMDEPDDYTPMWSEWVVDTTGAEDEIDGESIAQVDREKVSRAIAGNAFNVNLITQGKA